MRCHACQTRIELGPGRPLGFREECEQCGADLHVCLNCAHHDPEAYNGCRESSAERVLDRDRANRCDYFRPSGVENADRGDAAGEAKRALEDLFRED